MSGVRVRIRLPQLSDLPELTALYNHYVVSSPVTFDIEPFEIEQRRAWFDHYAPTGRHRLWVADADGRVVGYATSSAFRGDHASESGLDGVAPELRLPPGRALRRGRPQVRALLERRVAGEEAAVSFSHCGAPAR